MQTQEQTAEWMGYSSIDPMNAEHDDLHRRLCEWLRVPSYSMMVAEGKTLTHEQWMAANYEEDAVLYLQRFIQMRRNLMVR